MLRGIDFSAEPTVVRLWEDAAAQGHPLAALPLARLPLEDTACRHPQRFGVLSAGGWGGGILWLPDGARLPDTAEPLPALAVQPLSPEQHAELVACHALATQVSNGKTEGQVLRAAQPLAAISTALIAALPLSCHWNRDEEEGDPLPPAPAPPARVLDARPVTAAQVLAELMSHAANGGCYNTAWSGAWGRLAAWQSLAGLVGVSGPHIAVAEAAERCQWAAFQSDAGWFCHIVDFAVVCLRPDGMTVAVVAGTDTD